MSIDDARSSRCPSCGARVTAGAPWCTLCYADQRPAPAPDPAQAADPVQAGEQVQAPAASCVSLVAAAPSCVTSKSQSVATSFDPLTAPLHLLDPSAASAPADVRAVWPCLRCGTSVALDDATCPSCGAPFLAGATEPSSALERIVAGGASKQAKLIIMVGGSLGLLVLILGLMYLFGSVL